MILQTCRRHPQAGPFLTTCPGCAQHLHDIEQANRAHAAARTALTRIGTPGADILTVEATPTTLIIATRQPGSPAFEFTVDAFRLPTAQESDPDIADWARLNPNTWHLDWQAGDHTPDALPRMIADARQHLTATGRITHDTPTVVTPAPAVKAQQTPDVSLAWTPTTTVLPATQTAAGHAAATAIDALWDHAENCTTCLNAEDSTHGGAHCPTGTRLARRLDDAATVAADFPRLDDWYRRGGRERYNATDHIAS